MKNQLIIRFLAVLACLVFSFVSIPAQSAKQVKQIDAYRGQLDTFINRNKNRHPVFADVSDYRKDEQAVWKKYGSVDSFKRASKDLESYQIADLWERNERIVVADFSYFTPSGDWAQFAKHYYREDGTLAKVESQLNVFGLEGLISVYRNLYFDQKGKLLRKTAKYYDHEAKEWRKADQVHFMDRQLEIYKTTKELPFAALLNKAQG